MYRGIPYAGPHPRGLPDPHRVLPDGALGLTKSGPAREASLANRIHHDRLVQPGGP